MLSSNLSQKLHENDGIIGFLEEDLLKEVKRASRLVCVDLCCFFFQT